MGTGLASRNSCSGRWARLECGSRLRTRTFMETCCWRAAARGLRAAGVAWAARRPGRAARSGRSGAAPRRLAGRRAGWGGHEGAPGLRAALRSATSASAAGGSLARPCGFCSTGIWTAEFGGERSGEPSVCPLLRRGPSGSERVSSRWHPARARRSLCQQWLWF